MNLIEKITKKQIRTDLPEFRVGDTVRVDIKIDGLTVDIIREAFERTRVARMYILDEVMLNCKKYGLTLQLDQLSSTWSDTQWNNLFAVIKKYQMEESIPYENAKPMYLVDNIDNPEDLRDIVLDTYKDLKK